MNKIKAAKELLKLARELLAVEFPTQDAMDTYLKEHPDADRSNHSVKKQDKPAGKSWWPFGKKKQAPAEPKKEEPPSKPLTPEEEKYYRGKIRRMEEEMKRLDEKEIEEERKGLRHRNLLVPPRGWKPHSLVD